MQPGDDQLDISFALVMGGIEQFPMVAVGEMGREESRGRQRDRSTRKPLDYEWIFRAARAASMRL